MRLNEVKWIKFKFCCCITMSWSNFYYYYIDTNTHRMIYDGTVTIFKQQVHVKTCVQYIRVHLYYIYIYIYYHTLFCAHDFYTTIDTYELNFVVFLTFLRPLCMMLLLFPLNGLLKWYNGHRIFVAAVAFDFFSWLHRSWFGHRFSGLVECEYCRRSENKKNRVYVLGQMYIYAM